MANVKSPLDQMIMANGEGWEFVAVLGTDAAHSNSAYKLYLHNKKNGGWWCYEEDLPMVTARAEAPTRVYTDSLLIIRGPISRYPHWLLCHPDRTALIAADAACRALSESLVDAEECAA